MGRIRQNIKVDGRECWTLFDTGARNTYVVKDVAQLLTTSKLPHPFRSKMGGEIIETDTMGLLDAEVDGHMISTHAVIVEKIGQGEDNKSIEILFGALAMQQWGIRPVPDQEKLDMTHYPEVFVEF